MLRLISIALFVSLANLSWSQVKLEDQILHRANKIVDNWHLDASKSNLETYFDAMSNDFVFLGTDPKERWNKKEFYQFCEPYFNKKETWNFIAKERHWNSNDSGTILWFDEVLDTWMGTCRGVGVLRKKQDDWELTFYNLSVLIENEKIQKFIDLRSHE